MLTDYKIKILALACSDFGVVIATDSASLYLWNLSLTEQTKTIDLTNFTFKLFNFYVCDLVCAENKILVSTLEGDVVEILITKNEQWSMQKLNAKRMNAICKLSGQMRALSILKGKGDGDEILFAAGDQAVVYAFSLDSHEMVDYWSVSDPISAFDCLQLADGATVCAVGCRTGRVMLRVDWEEHSSKFEAEKEILDIKFSSNAAYLISLSLNGLAYVWAYQQ